MVFLLLKGRAVCWGCVFVRTRGEAGTWVELPTHPVATIGFPTVVL